MHDLCHMVAQYSSIVRT